MDKVFSDLIDYARKEYLKHINSKGNAKYVSIINSTNTYTKKFQDFNAAILPSIHHLTNLINPYFIGMGNPFSTGGTPNYSNTDSIKMPNQIENSILIFGQELGFNLNPATTRCFFEEQLSHHDLLLRPDNAFFNPYRANDYRKIKRHSHTWGVYSKFVAGLLDGNAIDYKNYLTVNPMSKLRDDYFEDHCFFTELYDSPSANHGHRPSISNERKAFFQSNEFRAFISRFKYIIIGDGEFSRNYFSLLVELFGITVSAPIQTINDVNKVCRIFKNKNQHIAISNYPLSNQWKYSFIDDICKNLK
jgi:hypothetical protein